MSRFDDSLVVLGCLLLMVGRSNAALVEFHAVTAPLFFRGGGTNVLQAKEFVVLWVAGAAATFCRQGRAILIRNRKLSREFDPTKGYAGQDILPCLFFPNKSHLHQVSPRASNYCSCHFGFPVLGSSSCFRCNFLPNSTVVLLCLAAQMTDKKTVSV